MNKPLIVYVANLDCESEAAAIERGIRDVVGVVRLKVYPKSSKVELTFDESKTSSEAIVQKFASLGFPAKKGSDEAGPPSPWRNPKVLASVGSGLLLLLGWLLTLGGIQPLVPRAVYLASLVMGAYFFAREAITDLVFERRVGIELLMTVAAVVATVLGQSAEGAMLAFLYSISEAAEGYTEQKTRSAIKALMRLAPKVALVRRGEREEEIPVEALGVGDLFVVKPGQAIPTDGVVVSGRSAVNESAITGESVPVEKVPEATVFAGTMNGEGMLVARASKSFADNTIARIIHMVEEAQEKKGRSQRFIERFGAWYSPAVLLFGVLLAIVPPVLLGASWVVWLARATVFIVAAAPCALVISIPITLVATLGTGARNGVLIKGGLYVELLAKVRLVAMDKTGTLTRGEPEVTDVLPSSEGVSGSGSSVDEILSLAAGIERSSQHPLAKAIVRYSEGQSIKPAVVSDFLSLTGAGASARLGNEMAYVGSPSFFDRELGLKLEGQNQKGSVGRLQGEGKTVVLVGTADRVWGLIAIRDAVRPNARKAVEGLHALGIRRVVMLTGDNELAARAIAREVGIDEAHAGLKPEDKVKLVRELLQGGEGLAMVGDGVNDAPALAEATVGVAMGAAGTDVALETADVALMSDDLEKLVYALNLARRNDRIVKQNLVLSVAVIGVLSVGALLGMFSLPVAVLGHEISEFLVVASGLRMLRS